MLALCTCPSLLDDPQIVDALPADVVARAKRILDGTHGLGARCQAAVPTETRRRSLARSRCCPGAYSDSKGIESARESVKAYIEERDGHPTDIESLYLTNGASEGVKTLLNMLISGPNDGVMIPIPQYPLYSATITALGGAQIGYYLDEGNDWAMTTANLDEVAAQARADGITPRALCIINPVRTECSWLDVRRAVGLMWAGMRVQGNPTGQVMSEQNIAEVIDWSALPPHPQCSSLLQHLPRRWMCGGAQGCGERRADHGGRGVPDQRLRPEDELPLLQEGPQGRPPRRHRRARLLPLHSARHHSIETGTCCD